MKKTFAILLFIISSLSLFATDKLTVLFTHDIHSHLNKAPYLKTLIDKEKNTNSNVVLLDAGDFSMGTLYHTLYTQEAFELRTLSDLTFDATTFGNHEFDFADDSFTQMYNTFLKKTEGQYRTKLLKPGNADYSESPIDTLNLDDVMIIERQGLKIAVFSVMGNNSIMYTPVTSLKFSNYIEEAKKKVEYIKKTYNPDFVILLSHTGTSNDNTKSEDELLAASVNSINFIISGHTHTTLSYPIKVNKTYIGSAGCYLDNLGKAVFERKNNEWELLSYTLIPIDENIIKDKNIENKINKYKNIISKDYLYQIKKSSDDIVFNSKIDFESVDDTYTKDETRLGDLLSDSLLCLYNTSFKNERKADIAVVPSGLIRSTINKGDVTVSDIFELQSLGNGADGSIGYPMCCVYIKGSEIVNAAEISASLSSLMSGAKLNFSGLKYKANKNRMILNKVFEVKVNENGEYVDIQKDKLYKVVIDLYSLRMLSSVKKLSHSLLSITPLDVNGKQITDFDSTIVKYKDNSEVKVWTSVLALADELKSQSKQIDEVYSNTSQRVIISSSLSLVELLKGLNKISYMIFAIIIFIICILVLLVIYLIKKIKQIKFKKKETNGR